MVISHGMILTHYIVPPCRVGVIMHCLADGTNTPRVQRDAACLKVIKRRHGAQSQNAVVNSQTATFD